jgi:arylamine N-acetyltransferase
VSVTLSQHFDPHVCLRDSTSLSQFWQAAQIAPAGEAGSALLLRRICAALGRIPYENLTKIISAAGGHVPAGHAKRLPDQVLRDFAQYGAGGTCFSLTAACVAVLTAYGFEAYPMLADRHYGTDTHCAVMLSFDGALWLLDPGYLLHQPARLPTTEPVTVTSGVQAIDLRPCDAAGRRVELFTLAGSARRSRLTYKVAPVDGPTFGRAWERSFTWDMMTYPVLTRVVNDVYYYLQGHQLRIRADGRTVRRALAPESEYEAISSTLGIDPTIVKHAFSVLT